MKKQQADDVLTIFSDRCTVNFVLLNGNTEVLKGCWCNECR